jgi:undecaprenyl-diphosphatase
LLTSFGASWFVYPAALLAAIALARRGGAAGALALPTGVVAAGVSQSLLKLAVSRPRPDLIAPLVAETTFSYPSGHAAMSAAFFGGLAAAVFRRTESRGARAAAVACAALATGAVALTRVILGVHWASDVAAGILIGLFWVAVLAGATPPDERRR